MTRYRVDGWFRKHVNLVGKTMQITTYHVGDDGDYEDGVPPDYVVLTTGQYSGTTYIEVAHYAAATLAFVSATKKITDSANGLVTFLTGDTIVVKGSGSNDGTYTVATGGVAGEIVTTEALADEAAGAMVSLYKRTNGHSNNVVIDTVRRKMWSRNTSTGEKVGEASTGLLIWADVTKVYTIYSSANTISCIMPGNIFRVIGGAALTQFHVGDLIDCAGFASASNNLPGYYVVSVTANVADLDIVVDPVKNVLVAEGAVGDSIGLVCRSIYNYAAGANLAGLSGYTDWRIPNDVSLMNLRDMEAPTAVPDGAAFPGWLASWHFSSTTIPSATTQAATITFLVGTLSNSLKTGVMVTALVRG